MTGLLGFLPNLAHSATAFRRRPMSCRKNDASQTPLQMLQLFSIDAFRPTNKQTLWYLHDLQLPIHQMPRSIVSLFNITSVQYISKVFKRITILGQHANHQTDKKERCSATLVSFFTSFPAVPSSPSISLSVIWPTVSGPNAP